MTIDRWGSMTPSTTPRPRVALGTKCLPCSAKGHHCDAHEVVDGRAVCLHCLDGVDCPRMQRNGAAKRDSHLPSPKQATRAIAAHEALCATPPQAPAAEAEPAPKTLPQPALAAGAMPVPAMPARRCFPKALDPSGKCPRGCGKSRHRGSCVGMTRNGAKPKPSAATGVEGLSDTEATEIVARAEEITARVEDEVRQRAVPAKAVAKTGKVTLANTKAETVTLNGVASAAERSAPALSAKSIAEGYALVRLEDVPGRKPASAYEGVVSDLAALPVGAVVTRTYRNKDIAHTFMCGITKWARARGLKVSQAQQDATIYVWRRA
jgi:hypothetical protein